MKTKEEVLENMVDVMPFKIPERAKPYILEALEFYASQKDNQNEVCCHKKLTIEDFHVGFQYQKLEENVWENYTYDIYSPRLYKIEKLIETGRVRRSTCN